MKLAQMNPFIRNAFLLNHMPYRKTVKNADGRLFYVIEGCGELTVNEVKYPFEKDQLVLWGAGAQYRWDFSKNNKCQLAVINFDYTREYSFRTEMLPLIITPFSSDEVVFKTEGFSDADLLNKPIFLKNMHIFKNEILDIISEFGQKRLFQDELCSAMLRQLIIKILRYICSDAVIRTKVEPILQYIRSNFAQEITNASLGELASYHPHYVNVLMKSYTGMTLHSYLLEVRLNEGLKYIVNTNESIEIIATKTGFKNPTHFSNAFKKRFGLSPSIYRKSSYMI